MKIGIVGTGISGLVCAHLLHPHHDITVFEADDRVGGHAHTVRVELVDPAGGTEAHARRHRVHRLQRAQLPELRPPARPARRGHPAQRDELQRQRPAASASSTGPRTSTRLFAQRAQPARARGSTACCSTSCGSTATPARLLDRVDAGDAGGRHRPRRSSEFARSAAATRRRLRRALPRAVGRVDLVGRPRHASPASRPRPTPASWTTTACCSWRACRSGARSPVGRSATSRPSPHRSPIASVWRRRCARSCAATPATTASRSS